MMPVVVTGASGFIGTAVCRTLMQHNIPLCRYHRHRIQTFPKGAICIHLAEPSNVRSVEHDPSRAIAEAVDCVHTLLHRHRFSKIVYASSGIVYGDHRMNKRTEEDSLESTHPYARMKQEVERLLLQNGHIVMRLANVYGEGMSSTSVVSHVISQLAEDTPVEIRSGSPIRDFLHIEDAARAFVNLARSPLTGVYNVGTGQGISIEAMTRSILALAGQPQRVLRVRSATPERSCIILDASKLHRDLGWKPTILLHAGLQQLIASPQRSMLR